MLELSGPFRPPLRFDGAEQELTFHAALALLSFGTGFDPLLLPRHRRGALETAQFGVLGLHLAGGGLDAEAMAGFGEFQVTTVFGVDGREDREVSPGVVASEPGPLMEYVRRVVGAVRGAGEAARAAGHRSLGGLVAALLEGNARAGRPTAAHFVGALVRAVPAFADEPSAALPAGGGASLPLHSRACHLAAELWARFAAEREDCRFPDAADVLPRSGAEEVTALRSMGCIEVSGGGAGAAVAAALEAQEDLGGEDGTAAPATALRAAAVAALGAAAADCGVPAWRIARWALDPRAEGVPGRKSGRQAGAVEWEATFGPIVRHTTAL